MRRAQKLYAQRYFGPIFGGLPEVKIELMIARWKSLDFYYPTQVQFSNLELIFPSKTSFSQDYFLLVQKVAKR